jgi:porin
VGVFFRFGASDGNPNPVKYAYNVGVSVNGMVPGRRKDTLGIGWAHTQLSSDFVPFLRKQLDLGLSVEDAVEIYYNAAITPWLNMAADLQIVDSALNKTLSSNGQLVNMSTAVVGGLRMYLRF